MAICGRCGQTESADEDCPYCSEFAMATSAAGAYAGSVSRASYAAGAGYGSRRPDHYMLDDEGRFQDGQAEPEFAALPPCERPFAAERTVWPSAPELTATPADLDAPDDELAIDEDEAWGSQPVDAEQRPPEQQRQAGVPLPEHEPEIAADPLQLAELNGHGRWIAVTAAILVVLVAAAGAVTLVAQHDRASSSADRDRPSVTASPSASVPVSVAPAGQNQLLVDAAAAAVPNEAAVVAFLDHYFAAVNSHDFASYKRLFIRVLRPGLSPTSFSASLGTTTDSSARLHRISVIGGAEVDASVTFISRPSALDSRKYSTCTTWSVEFHLGWRGTRYLLVATPLPYQTSARSCS